MNLSADFTRVSTIDHQPQDPEQDRAQEALHLPDLREGQCYLVRFQVGKSTEDQSYLDAEEIHEDLKRDPENGQVGPYFDAASGTVALRFVKPLGVLRALEMADNKNLEHDRPMIGRFVRGAIKVAYNKDLWASQEKTMTAEEVTLSDDPEILGDVVYRYEFRMTGSPHDFDVEITSVDVEDIRNATYEDGSPVMIDEANRQVFTKRALDYFRKRLYHMAEETATDILKWGPI